MRDETKRAVDAFFNHQSIKLKRTHVVVTPADTTLYLHGNPIACWQGTDTIVVTAAGYRTNVTNERLNGVCSRIFTHSAFGIRKGELYFGSWHIDPHAKIPIPLNGYRTADELMAAYAMTGQADDIKASTFDWTTIMKKTLQHAKLYGMGENKFKEHISNLKR